MHPACWRKELSDVTESTAIGPGAWNPHFEINEPCHVKEIKDPPQHYADNSWLEQIGVL